MTKEDQESKRRMSLLEMLTGARFGGVIEIGPDGPRIISAGEDDENPPDSRGTMIGKTLSRGDFSDYRPKSSVLWFRHELDGVAIRTAIVRMNHDRSPGSEPEEMATRDLHALVLQQEEGDLQSWLFWSLCPDTESAVMTPLRGTEPKVMHLANILCDYFIGALTRDQFAQMMADSEMRLAKMRAAGAGGDGG